MKDEIFLLLYKVLTRRFIIIVIIIFIIIQVSFIAWVAEVLPVLTVSRVFLPPFTNILPQI